MLEDWRWIREGDIVVTAISRHYAIGRVKANGMSQDVLATEPDCKLAIELACQVVDSKHRVFLFWSAGNNHCRIVTIDDAVKMSGQDRPQLGHGPVTHPPAA